jgi:cytochrome c oxidase subunit 4
MNEPGTPQPSYYLIFALLVGLTFLTVSISYLDLGRWHTIVGLTIASGKALLVALFFMHLLHSNKLTWLALGAGLVWLAILLGLTLSDYLTRHWMA